MQNLKVKDFNLNELSDILKIEEESFERPYSRELLLKEVKLPFSETITAEVNGKVVGYAQFWVIGKESELNRIAVKGSYRGLGIGKELLKEVIRRVRKRGARELFLEVNEENKRAIALHEKFGFRKYGERKGYYGNRKALLFKLNLEVEMLRDENLKALAREKFHHFKTLEKKHQELDDIIDKMEKKRVLTPQEEIELEKLKKERLRLRDEMLLLMKKAKEEAEK
jgi:ribosomal-protein-alanine acetyltransferase